MTIVTSPVLAAVAMSSLGALALGTWRFPASRGSMRAAQQQLARGILLMPAAVAAIFVLTGCNSAGNLDFAAVREYTMGGPTPYTVIYSTATGPNGGRVVLDEYDTPTGSPVFVRPQLLTSGSQAAPSSCSFAVIDASATAQPGNFSYTIDSTTLNFQQTLHQDAGLTTTPGNYARGCAPSSLGISSKDIIGVGQTTSGLRVMASAQYYTVTKTNQLFTLVTNAKGAMQSYGTVSMDTYPTALVATDLNGDQNNDIIAGGENSANQATVTVLLGKADGSFGAGTDYVLPGAQFVSLTVDDVNGDGKADIIAVSGPSNQPIDYSVLLGNGDGTFQAPVNSTTGPSGNPAQLGQVITAALTSSGHKDLISSTGVVFLGKGDGTFTQSSTQAPFSGANDLVSGDFNHDGKMDVAVTANDAISIFYGNGDGTFAAGPSYATIQNEGHLLALDMDGDGNLDLLTGDGSNGIYGGDALTPWEAYILMGNSDGTFVGAQSLPFANNGSNVADVNGDGNVDAVGVIQPNLNTTPYFSTWLGTASGILKQGPVLQLPSTGTNAVYAVGSYAVADFNGDGKPDLLFEPETAANYGWGAGFAFAPGNGDGSFGTINFTALPSFVATGDTDVNPYITGLSVADFNHDGKQDILYTFFDQSGKTGNYLEGFAVQLGNGDGSFKAPVVTYTYNSAQPPQSSSPLASVAQIADINHDGNPDVFAIAQPSLNSSQLQLYLGKGDGSFASPTTIPAADNPQGMGPIALGDLNGDGKLDLVSIGKGAKGGELAISLGNGDGTFAAPTILAIGTPASPSVAIEDFNGDGKMDVALTGMNFPYTGVFLGNGDGTLQTISIPSSSTVAPGVSIPFFAGGMSSGYDFNKDGIPDLIAGRIILLKGQAAAPTTAASTTSLSASAATIQAGQSVTLTATVSGPSGNSTVPTGAVTFLDGTTTLGTGTLNSSGVATYTTSALSAGAHSMTASYSGDSNFAASTSTATVVTVNAPALAATNTTLTASASTIGVGANLTLNATVAPASGSGTPTGTVTFMDGTATIGTAALSGGAASYSTTSLAAGTHSLTAAYGGDSNFSGSTSSSVSVTVQAATPSFTLSASPTNGTVTAGQSAQTTIAITPANGFNQQVSFACSGLPTGGTCSFSPLTVTPNGTAAATTTLTIGTAANTSFLTWPGAPGSRSGFLFAVAAGGFVWIFRRRRVPFALRAVVFLILAVTLVGCGGSSSKKTATQPQTYTVTVTATAGTLSQTTNYSLTVQ
ncbi:MAG: FG-GAP-like repeat-containing protein [Acidobacteriota bacterium]